MGLKIVHELLASDDPTTGSDRAVLLVMAALADDQTRGRVWCSLATMARFAGVARGTAFKAIRRLERSGRIVKTGKVMIGRGAYVEPGSYRQFVNEYRVEPF